MHVELNEANARAIQRICHKTPLSAGAFVNHIVEVTLRNYNPEVLTHAIIISIEKTIPAKNV